MDDSVYDTKAQKMSEMVILTIKIWVISPRFFLSFVFQSKSTENYKLTDKQKPKSAGNSNYPNFDS